MNTLEHKGGIIPQCDLEEIPLAYVEMDETGVVTYANREARDLQGSGAAMVGQTVWEKMPVSEQSANKSEFHSLMQSGQTPPVIRRTLYTVRGYRTFEIHRSFIRECDGTRTGIRSISIDVTEAVMAHEEAQTARNWMESVLGSAAEAIIVTDSLGFIRSVNPAAEDIFGWRAGELIGQILERKIPIVCYRSGNGSPLSFQMALHGPAKGNATVLNRNREEICVEISASPIVDKERGYTEGVVSLWRRAAAGCSLE
ncbi:MAG: PAS domain S-box protein [Acidobacteriota bacterium]|nr:PAS domain S-box protein [Acidobacteriota bacterium]